MALGGGGYDSDGNAHFSEVRPVTAATLGTGIAGSGVTTLTLSVGLPFRGCQPDELIVGSGSNVDTFTVNHTGGYTAGTTTLTVEQRGWRSDRRRGCLRVRRDRCSVGPADLRQQCPYATSSFGWYTNNTDSSTSTAYVICSK